GAIVSPSLALFGGSFLWWWSRRMTFRYRWVTLIVYAISPVLVHGTELGRPDHQSLVMLLVTVAICAEWTSRSESSRQWSALSGTAWGLALWVSFYEPLVLLAIVVSVSFLQDRSSFFAKHWRAGWICFAAILAIAFLIEQRIPAMAIFQSTEIFKNWTRTIGELVHVSPSNRGQRFGSLLCCRSFQCCVIGTRNFGLTKRNTPVGSNRGMNQCGCAIWQSICNRRRTTRFWRRGGFRHRSLIGQSNRAWLAAHTKAFRELQTALGSSFPKIGEARARFWRIAR